MYTTLFFFWIKTWDAKKLQGENSIFLYSIAKLFSFQDDFGLDKGYNYFQPRNNKPCRTVRNDNEAYTDEYPMAVYYRGQQVVITHPTKVGIQLS